MKMLLPILLRCHPATFLELPVKVGNVFDSDLVTDLLGGEKPVVARRRLAAAMRSSMM